MGYSDVDWASHTHCHSISGFIYFVGIGAITWSSKKPSIVTLSSTETEYIVLTHASKDILWIHKLLTELSSIFSFTLPTTLFCDNQGAIHLSKDATFHRCTKHIDVHFHFIHQTVTTGHMSLQYCPTNDMISNIFTKSLAQIKFEKFCSLLGLLWSCICLEGECCEIEPDCDAWYIWYSFVGYYFTLLLLSTHISLTPFFNTM